MKKDRLLPVAGLCLTAASTAFAANLQELDTVKVTATRLDQTLQNTAPNIDVVSRKALTRDNVSNIDDVTRYESDISVGSDPGRRGNGSFTIRGIDGNRVLMLIDGDRLPDVYAGGGNGAISGRDQVEMDTLKQIEVVKGPHSALFGSDALGGVVSYKTFNPDDFVDEFQPNYFGLKQSFSSANKGSGTTATFAKQLNDQFAGMVILSKRRHHEADNMGTLDINGRARTIPNPQTTDSHNILAKLAWQPNDQINSLFSVEHFERETGTDLLNGLGVGRGGVNILSYNANDKTERTRIALNTEWKLQGQYFQSVLTKLYWQKLHATDWALDKRIVPGKGALSRLSTAEFNQNMAGMDIQTNWQFGEHKFIAGVELSQSKTSRPRDLSITDSNGNVSKVEGSEVYPSNAFPDSKNTRIAVFAQDQFKLGTATITPALRYDHYDLNPSADKTYHSQSGEPPKRFRDGDFSPRLGVSLPIADKTTGFLTLSSGFRAPPFDTATMAFVNTAHGYQIIENPNLKSEKSKGIELGTRYVSDELQLSATTFFNRYTDFIERQLKSFTMNPRPFMTYRYENVGRVDTKGIEIKGQYKLNNNWSVHSSAAWTKGTNLTDKQPLNSIDPAKLILGVSYQTEQFGGSTNLTLVQRKKDIDKRNIMNPASNAPYFQPAGYGVVDAQVWWKPKKNIQINAGLYNLTNKKYWQWADVRNLDTTMYPADFYSMPGRNVSASIEVKF